MSGMTFQLFNQIVMYMVVIMLFLIMIEILIRIVKNLINLSVSVRSLKFHKIYSSGEKYEYVDVNGNPMK